MKKTTLLLLLCAIYFIGCKKETQTNSIILSGSIENPVNDSLVLMDKYGEHPKTIYLSDDNTFVDTLQIKKGYYYLTHGSGNDRKLIFLIPSLNLNVAFTNQDGALSLLFQGKGKNENNYLKEKIEFDKQFKKLENRKYFFNLNENTFLAQTDSIYSIRKKFIKSHTNLDNAFYKYEIFKIEYDRSKKLAAYKKWRGDFIKDSTFIVSSKFPDPFENIDLSDESLLVHPKFLGAVSSFVDNKNKTHFWNAETLTYLEFIDIEIENKKIKEEAATSFMNFRIMRHHDITPEAYSKYLSMATTDEKSIEKVKTYFDKINKIGKGTTSPLFEFYDLNDNLVKLKDLQGKLVYIDIWGTWCIPCVQEIPALKKLEEDFRNEDIYFVSISINDEKEKLKQFIKENDLKGIQLYAENSDAEFFQKIQLQGVPRFILIDRQGKVIDAFADKPSFPNIRDLILENL